MTRPFYWSVRRELWENRAIILAPLAAAAVVLLGFLLSVRGAPGVLDRADVLAAELRGVIGSPEAAIAVKRKMLSSLHSSVMMPYMAAGAGVMVVAIGVAIFYSLGALYNERRDRSVLFWKSLPVSDTTTVIAKAVAPIFILPLVVSVVAIALQLLMIGIETAVFAGAGRDPGRLWTLLDLPSIWLAIPWGMLCLGLWQAPVVGYLMLVSAWAKRTPILWALGLPAGICLFELLALHSSNVWNFLRHRLVQGFEVGFGPREAGGPNPYGMHQLDPVGFVTNPGLWGGLILAAAFLAGCIWLRRRRDPI